MTTANAFLDMACGLGWSPEDSVMVLWGYYDETGHPSDPNVTAFGVCGLRATCAQWLTFNEAWKKLLAAEGIENLHMKTFYSRHHEPYNGWSDAKKDSFLMSLVDLIETIKPVVGSMKKFPADGSERETIEEEWRESYHGCLRSSVMMLPAHAKVHFVFARHPEISQVSVDQYHGWVTDSYKQLWNDWRVGTLSFGDPKDLVPLQAADYVAWEIARDARNGPDPDKMRPTMRRLRDMRAGLRIYLR